MHMSPLATSEWLAHLMSHYVLQLLPSQICSHCFVQNTSSVKLCSTCSQTFKYGLSSLWASTRFAVYCCLCSKWIMCLCCVYVPGCCRLEPRHLRSPLLPEVCFVVVRSKNWEAFFFMPFRSCWWAKVINSCLWKRGSQSKGQACPTIEATVL